MFKRKLEPWDDPVRQADTEEADRLFLADPEALCHTIWEGGLMIYHHCERPIRQSVPHQHRQVERGHRYASEWANPRNYHNNFERAQIEAEAQAWLGEPLDGEGG